MSTVVAPALSTYAQIEQKVRFLTGSSGQSSLTSAAIQQYVNDAYATDFPYGIKLDQMRSVYTFYTEPYRDRYPLDVNYNQGVRAPMYVEGIQGSFYKDRNQFYNIWPRFPYKYQPPGLTMGSITGATQANPCQITSVNHGLSSGFQVYINGVVGMTQLNTQTFTITVTGVNTFTLDGVDSTLYTAYTSGGEWTYLVLSFMVPAPFLSKEVVYGTTDVSGNPISISDDGNGNLYLRTPNPVVSEPPYGSVYPSTSPNAGMPIPGMYNQNTQNPGLNKDSLIGTVNYVSGQMVINFGEVANLIPNPSVVATQWVSQYQTGRPWSLLFWNNEITIRPVPKLIHKIELEAYLTPVQFMQSTDNPILNQWWKYIALLAARQVLVDRQDMDGVANIQVELLRQEGLVLERQATEEIGQQNATIYNQVNPYGPWSNNWYGGLGNY